MSEDQNQFYNTAESSTWIIDEPIEDENKDSIVFENIPEQYVKGKDVIAHFTVLNGISVNEEDDRVGLMRIGTTNMKDCLHFAEVHFDQSTSEDVRHGTATFVSSILPISNEEIYQFCYLSNKMKNLGISIPFQLNFAPDDINLLNSEKNDSFVELADNDNDIIVIHTKRMLAEEKLRDENRQLSDANRQLEMEKVDYQTKLEVLENKRQDKETKLKNEIQTLTAARQQIANDLAVCQQVEAKLRAEYDACRAQCDQYKAEITEQSKRYQEFEENRTKILSESEQIRRQLATGERTLQDQQIQIADLERRLLQANETNKSLSQRHSLLENQIRELRATLDKHQLNMRTQIDEYTRQIEQRENQIKALQESNNLFQDELSTIKNQNDNLVETSQQDKILVKQLQDELEQCREDFTKENQMMKQQLAALRTELNEKRLSETGLTQSMKEIEKRCIKHQKQEVEAKRQLASYQDMIKDFEEQIRVLKLRLNDGAEKYQVLYRKYKYLEETMSNHSIDTQEQVPQEQTQAHVQAQAQAQTQVQVPESERAQTIEAEMTCEEEELDLVLSNSAPPNCNNQEKRSFSLADRASLVNINVEVQKCPVCDWEFPPNLTLEGKREHVEEHFNNE